MKKLVYYLLSFSMIFTLMSITAFADEEALPGENLSDDTTPVLLQINVSQDVELGEASPVNFVFTPQETGKYMLIVKGNPAESLHVKSDFDVKTFQDGGEIAYIAFGKIYAGKEISLSIASDTYGMLNVTPKKASFANITAKLNKTSYTYSGGDNKPVEMADPFNPEVNYTVKYANIRNAGTGTVKLIPLNTEYFYGSKSLKFTIKKKSLSSFTITKKISSSFSPYYTGKAKKPNILLYKGKKKLVKGTDYVVSSITYTNNKNIGTAKYTLKISGRGNYTGTKTLKGSFDIIPKKVSFEKPVVKGRTVKLKWKKGSNITGYEIYITSNKGYFKEVKLKKDTVSKTLTLPKGEYYGSIYTYKTVNGKKYSSWPNYIEWTIK